MTHRIPSHRIAALLLMAAAALLAVGAPLRAQEMAVEGTITLLDCPFGFTVCMLKGDRGVNDHRILEDTACLPYLGKHVLVRGTLALGGHCDPSRPEQRWGVLPRSIVETPAPICGDVDRDLRVDSTDAIVIYEHLFLGTPLINPVLADVNGDGGVDVSDAIYLLDFLYRNGPRPRCG